VLHRCAHLGRGQRELNAYRAVLRTPRLRAFLAAEGVSALGDGMSIVVIAWLAITIAPPAQRGLWVGLALAAFSLPASLGTVLFGRLAVRLPGARLIVADSALRLAALSTVVALGLSGALTPARYVALLALSSLLQAWGMAGKYTVIAEMLPDEHRVAGNALISVLTQTALIIGPALAGLAIPTIGPVWALSVDAVSYGILALVALRLPSGTVSSGHFSWRGLPALGLIGLTCAFFFLYGPVEVALPLHLGSPRLLGLFWTLFSVGAVIGGLSAAALGRRPLWTVVTLIVVGWGCSLLPLGLSDELWPGLIGFAAGGVIYGPFTSVTTALFQRTAPPDQLSRVLAARSALTIPSTATGTLLGGPLVGWLGAQETLLASGLLTIALGVGVAAFGWARSHITAIKINR
jgi:MFS family permease